MAFWEAAVSEIHRRPQFDRKAPTVPVTDRKPSAECQHDFGYMDVLLDPVVGEAGNMRTLVLPRHIRGKRSCGRPFSQALVTLRHTGTTRGGSET